MATINEYLDSLTIGCAISNYGATNNTNLYPVQEQISLRQIWVYDPIFDRNTGLWVLKSNVKFDEIRDSFLRMFVDARQHQKISKALAGKSNPPTDPRAKGAFQELMSIQASVSNFLAITSCQTKSGKYFAHYRIIDDCSALFKDNTFVKLTSFILGSSVYKAKKLSILFPDLCIAYDTDSRKKLYREYGIGASDTYLNLLKALNKDLRSVLSKLKFTPKDILEIRRTDKPYIFKYLEIKNINIKLQPTNLTSLANWNLYVPLERPFSRIFDKQFYDPSSTTLNQPKTSSKANKTNAAVKSKKTKGILKKTTLNQPNETKKEKAKRLYNPNKTRLENIRVFVEKAGLTKNGASTYYANFNNGTW